MLYFKKGFFITLISLLLCTVALTVKAQKEQEIVTHADTLRGTYGPSRDWWDVTHYDLQVKFDIANKSISGENIIQFIPIKNGQIMQIDLQAPMILDSIFLRRNVKVTARTGTTSKYKIDSANIKHDGNAYFISLKEPLQLNNIQYLYVYYHGSPRKAINPPWDGGLVWKKDKNNNPWVSVACQGLGASVWYPCKDHQADEPDSAAMHITIPDSLVCVGNGRERGIINNHDGTSTYTWAVTEPINNYSIVPSIGKYVHFGEIYPGRKGPLTMDYWVLDYNLEKAKKQFTDAPRMMKAFEYWMGPYPFYADGYKLVETPFLGMEHQSNVAYGNHFENGYLGRDLSGTGWGLKWDFIIVHESGHEWFGNNITSKDIADMWIHEGFTNYSEILFTDYYYGTAAGNEYVQGIRKNIQNDRNIIGPYNVNKEGSGDMYYKASNMIHMIRQIINDDKKFRALLNDMNTDFYHQTVTTAQVENYINKKTGKDFSKVFDQYLRTTNIPVLEYRIKDCSLSYRYTNCVEGFKMPIKIHFKNDNWITPTKEWQTKRFSAKGNTDFSVDKNFYIKTKGLGEKADK